MKRFTTTLLTVSLVATSIMWSAPAITADIPDIDPELGLVIVYRPKMMRGGAVTFHVDHSDGGSLGVLGNGAMLYDYFEPGQVTFYSEVLSSDAITINVEAGKVYFVRADSKIGLVVARPKFSRVDDKTGRAAVSKL